MFVWAEINDHALIRSVISVIELNQFQINNAHLYEEVEGKLHHNTLFKRSNFPNI